MTDLLKKRKKIDKILVELPYCKNFDKFYELCTCLYYNINSYVFNLESEKLKCEVDLDVRDNRADSN